MTVHLVKLCVGAQSVADLEAWIAEVTGRGRGAKRRAEHVHHTRMMPSRRADILSGGSLYWVIKGVIRVRQPILDLRPETIDGVPHCTIVLEPQLVPVDPKPMRPFQGWRYLDVGAAPADLPRGAGSLPETLARELAELGLL